MNAAKLIGANVHEAAVAHGKDAGLSGRYWRDLARAHEATIQALADQLAAYTGRNDRPDKGCHHATLSLDGAPVRVEFEASQDEPRGPVFVELSGVLINGTWVSVDVLSQDTQDDLERQLKQHQADEEQAYWEGVAESRAESRRAWA